LNGLLLQGTVILLFQPAEEAGNGAKRMIGDGALENVEAIFAVHVSHEHPTATIGSRPGPLLAGCGFFRAVIGGKMGRAENPHHSVDPILAASAAVISLQGIVSREANPLDSQVCPISQYCAPNFYRFVCVSMYYFELTWLTCPSFLSIRLCRWHRLTEATTLT
jgi:metal-dependent amidase/aminoacylase/carboxypeptidase family protein